MFPRPWQSQSRHEIGALMVLMLIGMGIAMPPVHVSAQDCSTWNSCETCTQHLCAWCELPARTPACTTNATCALTYAVKTCPVPVSTNVWSAPIWVLFLVTAIIMGIIIPLAHGTKTRALEEDVGTMASVDQSGITVSEDRVALSREPSDSAYCGAYSSSPSLASCCGVTVRQVFVSDEKFVVLSSNRAKMFFLLAVVLSVCGLWIGITFWLSGEEANTGALIFVAIVTLILVSLIILYCWSVTIAIIDRTENQLVLKHYRSMCNLESSQRYDIDRMTRIAIHREAIAVGFLQRTFGHTMLGQWWQTLKQCHAQSETNIYHVTFMTPSGPISILHNESLSSARYFRQQLGDFLHTNQLFVLHQPSATQPSFQPITPRHVEEENGVRRISSSEDAQVDGSGRRISGYAQHATNGDANEMLLNGMDHDSEMEQKYQAHNDMTKMDPYGTDLL